jgi:hypothetical protein
MFSKKYDVVVVGAGPGGIPAAIAASRAGMRTLLVERSGILGGLAVSGLPLLGYIDRSGNKALGGIAQEFIDELEKIDGATIGHFPCPVHNSLTPLNAAWGRIVFFDMVEKAGVDTLLYGELAGVRVVDGAVAGIDVLARGEKLSFETGLVIDATGDGCAAFQSGAAFEMGDGEEGSTQPPSLSFNVGGVDVRKVLEYIKAHPETTILPDTYGVSQTDDQFFASKGFAFTGFSEVIERARQNGDFDLPRDRIIFTTLPSAGEVLVNSTRALGIDMTNLESVIEGEFECHRQIRQLMRFFKKYAPGFENCFLASISPWLGGRESRRVVGLKTLTIADVDALTVPEDSIALAGYNVDIHVPGTEKLSLQPVAHAIGIPYGCIVSRDVKGLMMSGRCISVDRQAFGLTRIMGTCMAVGEAAGVAASLAVSQQIHPDKIDVGQLREKLRANGCVLTL